MDLKDAEESDVSSRSTAPLKPKFPRVGLLGAGVIGVLVFLAAFGEFLTPYAPDEKPSTPFQPPSAQFLLGTDHLGHDTFTLLLYGARTSLTVAVLSTLIGVLLIGLPAGFVAGYSGGKVDLLIMRFVDVFLSIPMLPLMIVIAAYLSPSIWNTSLVIGMTSWAGTARVIRAETLHLKTSGYVRASRAFGATHAHLLLWHFLPSLTPLLCSSMIMVAGRAIMAEAGLAFLGIGDPTAHSWGTTLRFFLDYASSYMTIAFVWRLLPLMLCIASLILSFSFIGNAFEEILDPRLRRGPRKNKIVRS